MARLSKEDVARLDGLQMALEIVEKGGVDALKEAIEAWNTRKPIEKVVEQRNKAIDEFLERCKSGVQNGELYDFVKWNNWNDCACEWFEKIAELLKGSEQE